MDKLSFGDREGHTQVPARRSYGGEQSLQAADVASIGGGGNGDREVVNVRDHKASGY